MSGKHNNLIDHLKAFTVTVLLTAVVVGGTPVPAAEWVSAKAIEVEYTTTDPSAPSLDETDARAIAQEAAVADQSSTSETHYSATSRTPGSPSAQPRPESVGGARPDSMLARPVAQRSLGEPVQSMHAVKATVTDAKAVAPASRAALADSMDKPGDEAIRDAALSTATGESGTTAAPQVPTVSTGVTTTTPASAPADRAPLAVLPPTGQYTVQPGDILQVTVWKEEDLQREVLVRPDGGISFPLAGDVPAAGHTVAQIQEELSRRIEPFIPEPVVTVAVKEVIGNRVYVVGRVNKPGEIIMGHELTVMQAISLAGGVTPFASLNKIHVIRHEAGTERSIPFRYGDVEKGRNLQQNIVLKNGDVVVVP